MKQIPFLLLISLVLITACQKNTSAKDFKFDKHKKQLLFFTDESNIQNEGPYYDALLEIKKEHPDAFSNMMIVSSSEKRDLGKYDVDTYPTLMVIYQNEIIAKIYGKVKKNMIVESVEEALSE